MPASLANNKKYAKFVRARNLALEKFHLKTLLNISAALHSVLQDVKDVVAARYSLINQLGVYSPQGKEKISQLEFEIKRRIDMLGPVVSEEMIKLRRIVYMLTYATEAEAIGQAVGSKTKYSLSRDKIKDAEKSHTFGGGEVEERVQYILNKLIRKIMSAVELSSINEDSLEDATERIERAFPKQKTVSTNQRNITVGPKLKEADIGPDEDMSFGYIDDETWDEMVDVYKSEYVPKWRGSDEAYTVKPISGNKQVVYQWEVEQEITQDFVYQVRQGQIDAAKENGIQDYIWIAIVDNRTDDCCLWRDGLTTQEIENELKTRRKDDECQAIVPPAHFNCRCALAPAVEEMPEAPESNEKEFESWLDT